MLETVNDETTQRCVNAMKFAEGLTANAPFLETPPALPYRYAPYVAYNDAKAFKLDGKEYGIAELSAGTFATGALCIVAVNRKTLRELPVVQFNADYRPVLASMKRAARFNTLTLARRTLKALERKYGAQWSYYLMSARCITGKLASYQGESEESA